MTIAAYYLDIKMIHITCVVTSVTLFSARGLWVVVCGGRLWRWLRVVPHLIDLLLLASGLTLAFLIRQYPFLNSDWLTVKVVGLIVYIAFGVWVFRGPNSRLTRGVVGTAALLTFGYIVSVAVTKQPAGLWRAWL